jgi:hypothetical protein
MASASLHAVRVWLDDRRRPPDDSWIWVTTPEETVSLLQHGTVEELSLDHDLGLVDEGGREKTGYDVLTWIEEQVAVAGFRSPRLTVHSANPPAHERMQRAIDSIVRHGAA